MSVKLPVRLSAYVSVAPGGRFFAMIDIGVFYVNLSIKSKFWLQCREFCTNTYVWFATKSLSEIYFESGSWLACQSFRIFSAASIGRIYVKFHIVYFYEYLLKISSFVKIGEIYHALSVQNKVISIFVGDIKSL
jgi:hypothetical protein